MQTCALTPQDHLRPFQTINNTFLRKNICTSRYLISFFAPLSGIQHVSKQIDIQKNIRIVIRSRIRVLYVYNLQVWLIKFTVPNFPHIKLINFLHRIFDSFKFQRWYWLQNRLGKFLPSISTYPQGWCNNPPQA